MFNRFESMVFEQLMQSFIYGVWGMLSQRSDNMQNMPFEVQTKFRRRLPAKENHIFVFPDEDDVLVHRIGDIVVKLPVHIIAGGTARSRNQFKFHCPELLNSSRPGNSFKLSESPYRHC